jgi:hypothetical protein
VLDLMRKHQPPALIHAVLRCPCLANHQDPVRSSHLPGGHPGSVAKGSHGPGRDVPKTQKGDDVMSAHVAVVAGAGGALGHATALTLAAGGLTVVAVDRNERGFRQLPGKVRREVADTTDPAVAARLIDRIADEVGPPDVLVNTIGAFSPGDPVPAGAAAGPARAAGGRSGLRPAAGPGSAAGGCRCSGSPGTGAGPRRTACPWPATSCPTRTPRPPRPSATAARRRRHPAGCCAGPHARR